MMTQRLGRVFAVFAACAMLWHSAGCAAIPKTFEEGLRAIDKVAEVAERQGVSWHADLIVDGDPQITAGYQVTADTSLRLKVHFQGNAKNAAAGSAPSLMKWLMRKGWNQENAQRVENTFLLLLEQVDVVGADRNATNGNAATGGGVAITEDEGDPPGGGG